MQLKLGAKGELVIPKKIREHLGLSRDRPVILEVKEKVVCLRAPETDIVRRWEARARRCKIDPAKLVYGDKLYEEMF